MKMESQVWYAEPAVELNPPSRGSDAAAAAAPPAAVAKSPVQGKRRQPVRAGVRRRGQPPGQGKRRPPARARAEELLNNHMPPAIPSDPPQALPGGGFFGKPLHSFARFRQQNAQTPPSPRVGEGDWGDEGQQRAGMQKIAVELPPGAGWLILSLVGSDCLAFHHQVPCRAPSVCLKQDG